MQQRSAGVGVVARRRASAREGGGQEPTGRLIAVPQIGSEFELGAVFINPRHLRVAFNKNNPPRVTMELATYVLNCVSFAAFPQNSVGQRILTVRINDGVNPAEGRAKLRIDVLRP
eukprot:gene902-4350_t